MNKMKDFLMPQDDFDDEDEVEELEERPTFQAIKNRSQTLPQGQPKLMPVGANPTTKMEILNFTMSNYEMTGEIFNYIKGKKPVIVNMQQLGAGEVQRAVDYLTGACFALNGSVERVAENIFVFAPENVALSPEQLRQKNNLPIL